MTQQSDNYTTEEAQLDRDYEQLLRLFEEGFVREEPLNKSVNLKWSECSGYFDRQIRECVQTGSSIVAREKSSGKTVACAMNNISHVKPEFAYEDSQGFHEKIVQMIAFVDLLRSNVSTVLPVGSRYLELCSLVVHPTAYRRGLARRLVEKTIEKAKNMNCDYVITVATNFVSQALFSKLHFRDIKVINLTEYCDLNGKPIFQCKDGTKEAKLMYLQLDDVSHDSQSWAH